MLSLEYPERSAVVPPSVPAARRYLYELVSACVILLAAALRFYELSEHALWYDEIVAASNSLFTLSDVFRYTRESNSSPIVYPILLWVVQKISVSPLSLRIIPAVSSVLVVAALMLLLPRVGVDRATAFFSGLLATVSATAIHHAQDAREYSIDALISVLLIVGLLAYLRNGRKFLLCATLFVAPLIQYGLILFCVAIIATAVAMKMISSLRESVTQRNWRATAVQTAKGVLWPVSLFFVSCLASYLVTADYHWNEAGFGDVHEYLAPSYYLGSYGDGVSILEFIISHTFLFFGEHMSDTLAILASVLFAGGLARVLCERKQLTAVSALFIFSVLIALLAAILKLYPFGGIRQTMYLSPVLLLTFGHALSSVIRAFPDTVRKTGVLLVSGIILYEGANNVVASRRGDAPLHIDQEEHVESILNTLERERRDGDYILLAGGSSGISVFEFYFWRRYREGDRMIHDFGDEETGGDIYRFRKMICPHRESTVKECLKNYMWDFYSGMLRPPHRRIERLWIVSHVEEELWETALAHRSWRSPRAGDVTLMENHSVAGDSMPVEIDIRTMITSGERELGENLALYRVENFYRFYEPSLAVVSRIRESDQILIEDLFDVYLRGRRQLVYVKDPCASEDTLLPFDLHIFPQQANNLDDRGERDFNVHDFRWGRYGIRYEARCVVVVDLPEYDIARIRTGQYSVEGVGPERKYTRVWVGSAEFNGDSSHASFR